LTSSSFSSSPFPKFFFIELLRILAVQFHLVPLCLERLSRFCSISRAFFPFLPVQFPCAHAWSIGPVIPLSPSALTSGCSGNAWPSPPSFLCASSRSTFRATVYFGCRILGCDGVRLERSRSALLFQFAFLLLFPAFLFPSRRSRLCASPPRASLDLSPIATSHFLAFEISLNSRIKKVATNDVRFAPTLFPVPSRF